MMTESSRKLNCWIESFVELTSGLVAPRIFRLWAGISTVSGLLERRVFTITANRPVVPNMFVLLVAPPGVGKSMILSETHDFWLGVKDIKLAPDNMTKAALMDVMVASGTTRTIDGMPWQQHALQIVASEFGVFCPAHDLEFLSTLTRLYDCGPSFRENRRSTENQIDIINPQISLIAGTQPDYLAHLLPAAAWGQGFMSRMLMVYSDEVIPIDLFDGPQEDLTLRTALKQDANVIGKLVGTMGWSLDAKTRISSWMKAGQPPVPEHFKLKHYVTRRTLFTIKLAMISSTSRGNGLVIDGHDVSRAIGWLTDAEAFMPEIFKSMAGNSDYDVLQELRLFVAGEYARTKKPVHEQSIIAYLQRRTPVGNILNILRAAESSGLIERITKDGKEWKPGLGELEPRT
jgi:hypothetical protein